MKVYAIQLGNRFLNTSDEVKSPTIWGNDNNTAKFPSEDAAVAKATALGLDLEKIQIIPTTQREG